MKDSKGNEYDGWAIKFPSGWFDICSVKKTRQEVIEDWEWFFDEGAWRRDRRRGFKLAKAKLVEVAT